MIQCYVGYTTTKPIQVDTFIVRKEKSHMVYPDAGY